MAKDKLIVEIVEVVDVKMKFGSMVSFMVKWVFASIPAALIIYFIFVVFAALTKTLLIG